MGKKGVHIISLVLLFFCIVSISRSYAQEDTKDRQLAVVMRLIGDKVLLSTGDSLSRVLPIEKEGDRHRIRFESEFHFAPGDLVSVIDEVINETQVADHYLVEVEHCESKEVVYSYEMMNFGQQDLVPCAARGQPKSCYNLLITLLASEKELVSATQVSGNPVYSRNLFAQSNLGYYVVGLVLVIACFGLLVFSRRKEPTNSENPNIISLGKYQYDTLNMELAWENVSTQLTSKEADLLMLLHNSANNTLKREVILQRVWGDEGDYIGRTLDVFISKLRKKLEADPAVKIVNVRGIGYKLVLGSA